MLYMRVCQDKDTACDFRPQIAALSLAGKPVLINICLSPLTMEQTRPLCCIFVSVSLFLSCIYTHCAEHLPSITQIVSFATVLRVQKLFSENLSKRQCQNKNSIAVIAIFSVKHKSNFIVTMGCQAPKRQANKYILGGVFFFPSH